MSSRDQKAVDHFSILDLTKDERDELKSILHGRSGRTYEAAMTYFRAIGKMRRSEIQQRSH